jgi:hypothetical protein
MNTEMMRKSRHYGRLAFMAVVTAWLLAAVFTQAAKGTEGMFGAVAFAFAAGFGLEFLCASWTGRAHKRAGAHSTLRR